VLVNLVLSVTVIPSMMSRLSNSVVLFSFLKIDHEARVTRQGRGVRGMRPAAENTLSQSFSDRTRNGINPVVNSNLNNTLS
jgi:hypothetical protein